MQLRPKAFFLPLQDLMLSCQVNALKPSQAVRYNKTELIFNFLELSLFPSSGTNVVNGTAHYLNP
jgi:hypothetical protein